jgi:HCOMODA/2-hydroxy-3-carboxy-muconic semialdehyde decarboxylase
MPLDSALIDDLVAANRILVDQGVLDGYGHVSVRHPADPQRYLMSRSIAPELVTAADVMEYDLDSNPVDARGRTTYLERFIHGEVYRARPDVRAVVHDHSPSVIPFGVSTAPLRPLYHMSAFLGGGVPVFDIKTASGQSTDMLVRNPALGKSL